VRQGDYSAGSGGDFGNGKKSEPKGIARGGRIFTKSEGWVQNFLHDECAAEVGPGNARAEERGRVGRRASHLCGRADGGWRLNGANFGNGLRRWALLLLLLWFGFGCGARPRGSGALLRARGRGRCGAPVGRLRLGGGRGSGGATTKVIERSATAGGDVGGDGSGRSALRRKRAARGRGVNEGGSGREI